MRQALVAALAVFALGHGFASAQEDAGVSAGMRASVELLSGWIKGARVPPLVTTRDTAVLLDNLDFADRAPRGARLGAAYRIARTPYEVEADYFFLSSRRSEARFASSSSGDPLIARPFINAATGMPDDTRVSSPGVASGSLAIGARTRLSGAEIGVASSLISRETCHIAALAGLRFLRLEDELGFDQRFDVFPGVAGFGGSTVDLHDGFRADNRFFGAQVGIDTGVRNGALTIDFRGKLGVGQMRQAADIDGATSVLAPTGSRTVYQGGLLALRTNIGSHRRSRPALIPEGSLGVGWRLTRNLKATAGYSLLWIDRVARAPAQIDPVVNTTQFPILSGSGLLVGAPRPAFDFNDKSFWMQRVAIGLDLKF